MIDLNAIFEQRKLNNQAERVELPKAFKDKFPDMKAAKADKLFRRYCDTVMDLIVPQLPFLHDGQTYLSLDKILNECRDFQEKHVRYWLWNEFKDIYPLFHVVKLGNNLVERESAYERNTKVQINVRMVNMLLEERSPKSVFEAMFDQSDLDAPEVERITINMENLANYIGCTEHELRKNSTTSTAYRAKLEKSLYQARIIHKIGEHTLKHKGYAHLPMIPVKSVFGRTYYKGMNVQNVTKEVRSALIGPHFQYDMNAAVFAVKLALYNLAHDGEHVVLEQRKASYTREYLDEKDAIRKRLAEYCFSNTVLSDKAALDAIKQAMTAIGFGAKTTSGFWFTNTGVKGSALTEIIKNKESREKFLSDPWVAGFLAEQQDIEEVILDTLRADEENFEATCAKIRADKETEGQVRKSHLLAYYYQQFETVFMDEAVAILEKFGVKAKARIHDAIVVMDPIPAKVMDEVYVVFDHYSRHLRFSRDDVREWISPEFKVALDDHAAQLAAHREHIKREEQTAWKRSRGLA